MSAMLQKKPSGPTPVLIYFVCLKSNQRDDNEVMPAEISFQLRASEVSALAGRHVHRPTRQAIRELVDTTCPVYDARTEYLRSMTAKMEREVRYGPCYRHAVSLTELDDTVCRRAEAESLSVFDRFSPQIPFVERRRLRRNIRTVYLKDRGVLMEIHTLRRLGKAGVRWMPTDKGQRFFTREFTLHADDSVVTYRVNGCVDGIEFDDKGEPIGIIEVKTRRDKAYYPLHDLDQVMMYLVLSQMPRARLVQDVNGHLHTDFIMTLEEATRRWDTDVRPLLETSLREAARQVMRFGRPADATATNTLSRSW